MLLQIWLGLYFSSHLEHNPFWILSYNSASVSHLIPQPLLRYAPFSLLLGGSIIVCPLDTLLCEFVGQLVVDAITDPTPPPNGAFDALVFDPTS